MGHVRKVPSKRQAVVVDDTKLNLLIALEENPITPARQLARDIWKIPFDVCQLVLLKGMSVSTRFRKITNLSKVTLSKAENFTTDYDFDQLLGFELQDLSMRAGLIITDRTVDFNRPDIVLIHKEERKGIIINIAVPLTDNIERIEREKIAKYENL
ncbi:hypothetical protein NQ318_011709 [Aromia moschata]|uniref:Uncharacterized protein n=1 Tax=Aromia moschata TaxID=1265417 RepID=A0AAV8XR48_9CUCU|nr:hypothetical protein NQ318_011709 [Aromia moschata]